MTIADNPITIRETHNFGPDSQEWVLHRSQESALGVRGIDAVGWVVARNGYFFARQTASRDLIYVCLEGWGEVLIGDRWQRCGPDTALLAPAGQPQIYRSVPNIAWRSCWALGCDRGFVGVSQPALVPASGQLLLYAIQGLHYEVEHRESGDLSTIEHWIELISSYTRRIGHPEGRSSVRLRGVWETVLADLSAPWSVSGLAHAASLSEESIRRISLLETGRPPMEQVTFLRMRRAAALMVTHPYSIASVAQRVGYPNPMTFSTAFRRVMGVSPSEYRRKHARYSVRSARSR